MKTDQTTINARAMYDEYRFGDFNYGQKRERFDSLLFKYLSKLIKLDKNKKLFDIGCGSGEWLEIYLKHGLQKDQITGVDIAPSNISELNKKGFNAVCSNVLNLELGDNVSDFTVCNGVIHHTSNPYKALCELVRITKPGGYIYLNVYNKWHPYFYIVHRAMFPLRFIYWHINKKVIDIIYHISKIFFQPIAYIVFKEFLNDKTGKAFFMDQVITSEARLFSKSDIKSYAKKLNCSVCEFKYNRYFLMLGTILKVN